MKSNEMKIKVIEKPMVNFGDLQKLNESELNVLRGGTDEDDELELYGSKKCLIIFGKFKIGDACICYTKKFLAATEDIVLE